jgi:subtilase family serine protease
MSMRRAIAAVIAAAGLAWLSTPPSDAVTPTAAPVRGDHLVCGTAAVGYAACAAHVQTDQRTARAAATAAFTTGLTPAALQSVYGPFGTGAPLVAVVDAYASPNAAADLAAYRTKFGLGTATFTQVNQTGGAITTVTANVGWGQEEMLDLEMVAAVCPQCSILYVGASSASFPDLGTAVQTAAARGAKVISNSYGAGEFASETAYTQWNVPGVAVTVASGDVGYGVEFPAASAGVIAVGGTTLKLTTAGKRASETVWTGSGSGCSAYIAKPAWQTDKSCTRRTVTDVAAVADPATGVAVYDSYGSTGGLNWYVFGGTSVATPIVGAIFARDGITATPAKGLYTAKSGLYDVASGKNGTCTTKTVTATAYLCTGSVGYDGPTGNGTPNGVVAPF